MKDKLLYTLSILVLLALVFAINYFKPKEISWVPTYSQYDKQPFGDYALDEILSKSWKEGYSHNYKTITWLLLDETLAKENLLIVTVNFSSYGDEVSRLMDYVKEGHQVMIVAEHFDKVLSDTLGFERKMGLPKYEYGQLTVTENSKRLRFCNDPIKERKYKFPEMNILSYFDEIKKSDVVVVAENDDKKPVMLRYPLGKGNLIVCCNPKIFTNYTLLDDQSKGFILSSLGYLKGAPLMRTEYYHMGLNKSTSPFRYLMSNVPLRWAFILTIVTILLFMIFTAKRKQRSIPIILEPENRMLGFIRSISELYLRKNNNADIVRKKYIYWADHIKREYGLDIINGHHDNSLYASVATKTGHSAESVRSLFQALDRINENTKLSDKEMTDLVNRMDLIN